MIDSLLTVALIALPTNRPNMMRESALVTPAQGRAIVVQVASVKPTELLTTCYVNADNTCWGK